MKWNSNDKIKSTWLLDQLLEWSYENQQLNAAPAGLISRGRLDLSPRYPQPRIRILKNLPSFKEKVRVIIQLTLNAQMAMFYNGTLETLIWSIMWKIYSRF